MATYSIDTAHSEIAFTVRHMMFAKVRGQFKTWSATLSYDPANASASNVQVEIDVASIDTHEAQRDGHLRSGDFFDAEKFPKITFASKRVESTGKGRYKLAGDLTIHGVTNEVTLEVEQTGHGKDPWGNERLGFNAKATILRSDFGLKWNQALETGGVLVSDKVEIEAELQVVQARAAA
ncbi:YceI family protein [Pendulispora brunnea]|uniref:YceI family protein n=1 Tax=Pendulispora brunnea TaxID=2905690 RepID=A0ABZ2KAK5_9BACT